mmetsp:Transcript_60890/g.168813  ORF Transcript_60890/g.168813 Transcript_60890/m.168813 type:complete len:370 (+) Transcript_60890:78-1187(+)
MLARWWSTILLVVHLTAEEPKSPVRSNATEQCVSLQTVSLEALDGGSPEELRKLVQACANDGFFYLTDHGLSPTTLYMVLNASRAFFMQPQVVKDSVHYTKTEFRPTLPGVCGYVRSQDENVGPAADDLLERKEAFDWVTDRPPAGQPFHGPNLWPDMPGFREALELYRAAMDRVSNRLLDAFAKAQGLDPGVYRDMCHDSLTWTRITHYPPRTAGQDDRIKGVNAHTDGDFFTLVLQDSVGGLQAKFRGEEWVRVRPLPGSFVVNIGDCLAALSGGVWRSTPHRVISGEEDRLSVAHFVAPDADALSFASLAKLTRAAKVLLFKAGLGDSEEDLEGLRRMTFAEYRLRVYSQYLPDRVAHHDFTDINH